MNIYSVESGDIKYVSDASNPTDACQEILDKTFNGCTIGRDIVVTDMMTGVIEYFDSQEVLIDLGFYFED